MGGPAKGSLQKAWGAGERISPAGIQAPLSAKQAFCHGGRGSEAFTEHDKGTKDNIKEQTLRMPAEMI